MDQGKIGIERGGGSRAGCGERGAARLQTARLSCALFLSRMQFGLNFLPSSSHSHGRTRSDNHITSPTIARSSARAKPMSSSAASVLRLVVPCP